MKLALAALAPAIALAPLASALATDTSGQSSSYELTVVSAGGVNGHVQFDDDGRGGLRSTIKIDTHGLQFDEKESLALSKSGNLIGYSIQGSGQSGPVNETYSWNDGTAKWNAPMDRGSASQPSPDRYYLAENFTSYLNRAALLKRLLSQPGASVRLVSGGVARAARLNSLILGQGKNSEKITLWSIGGVANKPYFLWADEDGRLFAMLNFVSVIRSGYENQLSHLQEVEQSAQSDVSAQIAHRFEKLPSHPVAFTHVRAFIDGQFADDQTIVVNGNRIVSVGPATGAHIPADAQIIPGAGRTLLPGLWDSHLHIAGDESGLIELATGVTSLRDPGNFDQLTVTRKKRRAAGNLLMPHIYSSSLIDGKGPYSAPVGTTVTSEAETIQVVDRAKEIGQTGVKFYGSMNPAWIKPAADEAHRLGLHVHGHLPAGMRPLDAINAGYDELTHVNLMTMQAMPDDIVAHANTSARFTGPGRYAKDMDLDGGPMHDLIAIMAQRHIYADPTLVVFEGMYVTDAGELPPSYQPYAQNLSPLEKGERDGSLAVAPGVTRADYKASFRRMIELVGRLHKAGVQIVAGTDGEGPDLIRELELYVQAGFTPAEALDAATIIPARLQGVGTSTGSIAAGKTADLLLVDGDPSKDIGTLRHSRMVMMDGSLMDSATLRGMSGLGGDVTPEATAD